MKVAKVVDDFKVVINAGSANNINVGDVVMLYEMDGNVIDPDTGADLGELEIVKGTGSVTHVQERMSTVVSNMTESEPRKIVNSNIPGTMNPLAALFGTTRTEEIPIRKKPFEEPHVGTLVKIVRHAQRTQQ